jgi:hypothetical protein
MRGSYFDSADSQRTERMQAEYFARRRRGAPAYDSMVNNVNDMLAFEDGHAKLPVDALPIRVVFRGFAARGET